MNPHWYRFKKFFLSGALRKHYLVAASSTLGLAAIAFSLETSWKWNAFAWQALMGIFTGVAVGYLIDAMDGWHKTRFLSEVFAPISVKEQLPVVVANLNDTSTLEPDGTRYKITGPGETIAIGLLFSAYSTLFSTASKSVSLSKISVFQYDVEDGKPADDYDGQRIILGGPRYNLLTRAILARENINIHYPTDAEGHFLSQLKRKDETMSWEKTTKKDFGLVLKLGKQLHASGCGTWGVSAAAACLFTEASAALLVMKLKQEGINSIADNYYAVVSCSIRDPKNHYSIQDVTILCAEKIRS